MKPPNKNQEVLLTHKKMNILIESMTKLVIQVPLPNLAFTIRCWRQEERYNSATSSITTKEIWQLLKKMDKSDDKYEIAKNILSLDRMNAVEVLDGMDRGVVLYRDWP